MRANFQPLFLLVPRLGFAGLTWRWVVRSGGVTVDQANEFVRQWFARDLIVHRVQLLVQPKIEGTLFRIPLAWTGRVAGGPVPRPVFICHDVLSMEGRPFEGGLSTPLHSPITFFHYATSPACLGDVASRSRCHGAAEWVSEAVTVSSSAIFSDVGSVSPSVSRCSSLSRAREIRLFTVPTDTPVCAAMTS
jgi:hypothetical protein